MISAARRVAGQLFGTPSTLLPDGSAALVLFHPHVHDPVALLPDSAALYHTVLVLTDGMLLHDPPALTIGSASLNQHECSLLYYWWFNPPYPRYYKITIRT